MLIVTKKELYHRFRNFRQCGSMRQQNRLQNSNFAGSAGSCDRITQQDQQQQFVEKS